MNSTFIQLFHSVSAQVFYYSLFLNVFDLNAKETFLSQPMGGGGWRTLGLFYSNCLKCMAGIGIEVDAAGIGIPASCIAVRYRTGSSYSGIGMVQASAFLFIPVPDWLDAGQSDIPAFKKRGTLCTSTFWWLWKRYAVHVQTAGSRKWWCYSCYVILKNQM